MTHTPEQTPDTHVEFMQATGAPSIPCGVHGWTLFPEQCCEPGTHEPVHWPPEQTPAVHGEAVPQCPVPSHVWTPFPSHWVEPATHSPAQSPATQVWATQALAMPQVPSEPQVCTPFCEHCTVPGSHATHAPFQQTGEAPAQVTWFIQVHWSLQVCTRFPAHWVCPGLQTPVHVGTVLASPYTSSPGASDPTDASIGASCRSSIPATTWHPASGKQPSSNSTMCFAVILILQR
jgi:hypothetical protein